jgi:hypothetical protein
MPMIQMSKEKDLEKGGAAYVELPNDTGLTLIGRLILKCWNTSGPLPTRIRVYLEQEEEIEGIWMNPKPTCAGPAAEAALLSNQKKVGNIIGPTLQPGDLPEGDE